MKRFKIFLAIIACLFVVPFTVFAEKDTKSDSTESVSKKVNIYFFYGDGCPHCAEAEEFFESIEEKYSKYYNIVAFETWYDSDNADLLQEIAEVRDENITGVPYILIGNKSWAGYSSSLDDDIISAIEDEYETDVADRYDIKNYVDMGDINADVAEDTMSNDAMILIILILVCAGIGYGLVVARKNTI